MMKWIPFIALLVACQASADWKVLLRYIPTENEDSPIVDVISCRNGFIVTCYGDGDLRGIVDAKMCHESNVPTCVDVSLMDTPIECAGQHSMAIRWATQVQIIDIWGSDGEQSFVVSCGS